MFIVLWLLAHLLWKPTSFSPLCNVLDMLQTGSRYCFNSVFIHQKTKTTSCENVHYDAGDSLPRAADSSLSYLVLSLNLTWVLFRLTRLRHSWVPGFVTWCLEVLKAPTIQKKNMWVGGGAVTYHTDESSPAFTCVQLLAYNWIANNYKCFFVKRWHSAVLLQRCPSFSSLLGEQKV